MISRGGNSLLIDDDKLTAFSAPLIPGEAKPLPEGATKWKIRPFHAHWDSAVVDYAMRRGSTRTAEQFAQKMIDENPVVAGNTGDPATWPYQWANESLVAAKLARGDVTVGKREFGANYPVPSSALARTQLVKGGYHLASLFKAIWP